MQNMYSIKDLFGTVAGLFSLTFVVLCIIGYWLTFEKAGTPGWHSIIPIWNTIVYTKIAVQPENHWVYWLLSVPITIIPGIGKVIGLIMVCYVNLRLSSRFTNNPIIKILAIIPFTFPITIIYLGLSDKQYK